MSLKVYLIFLKGVDASYLFFSISSVCARVTGRSERMSSVIQSSWTLREAMTKKGRCSVFRQRPFDVSATTECCGVFASGRRIFLSRISEVRGKIGNLRAHPDFDQQNRRSRMPKTGVWPTDLGFSLHFRNHPPEVCGKFRNPRAHRPFHE